MCFVYVCYASFVYGFGSRGPRPLRRCGSSSGWLEIQMQIGFVAVLEHEYACSASLWDGHTYKVGISLIFDCQKDVYEN